MTIGQIKALCLYGRNDVRVTTLDKLPCKPTDVRVKVEYCGICGTDLHEFLGGPVLAPKPGETNPYTGCSLPVVLGHEAVGTITEVGIDVKDIDIGQHVVVNPAITDRELGKELCDGCKQGKYNVCSRMSYYGFSAACGGLSDEMVVNSMNVFKIPNHIPLEIGALVEPLSVAWHSVSRSKFSAGQNALILGSGPIGLGLILVLKIFGANKIILSEIAEQRAQQAVNFGATAVVNPLQQDILKEVTTICGSKVDISYEATGLQTTLDTALDCTRPGGTVYNIAIHEKALSLNPNQLVENEIYYTAGNSYTHEDIYSVVDALATGKVDPRAMITSVVPLEKGVEDGIMELVNNREKPVKILVKPGA